MLGALALVFAPAGEAAKRKPAKRAQVVCFKSKGKKVCRKRRAAKRPAVKLAAPAPRPTGPATASAPATSAPTPSLPPSAPVPSPVPMPEEPTKDCGPSPWVGYTAEDVDGVFKLTGRRTCVPGPQVLFQLRNIDAQEHNLYAEKGSETQTIIANVLPGETAEASATLSAGDWRLFCDVEGHETMSRTLSVGP